MTAIYYPRTFIAKVAQMISENIQDYTMDLKPYDECDSEGRDEWEGLALGVIREFEKLLKAST